MNHKLAFKVIRKIFGNLPDTKANLTLVRVTVTVTQIMLVGLGFVLLPIWAVLEVAHRLADDVINGICDNADYLSEIETALDKEIKSLDIEEI